WETNADRLDWRHRSVRQYLEAAAGRIRQRPREAYIESAFLAELAVSRGPKQDLLRKHQPVRLGRLPFQFPLPVSGRAEPRLPRRAAAGHVDVLARGAGGLRVFEVKRPGADDAGHALAQAVAYAAALRLLLSKRPEVYLPMLGYSSARRSLRIDAVALVD